MRYLRTSSAKTSTRGRSFSDLRSLLTRGEVQLQHVEIADLLRNVLTLCRGTLKERRVQIDLRIDAGIPAYWETA